MLRNSAHARDIDSVLHPHANARSHLETGPTILTHGKGIYIHDDAGNAYLDSGAALWCASLGHSNERLAKVAHDAMCNLGYFQIFREFSHHPAIDLSEKLLSIAPVPMSKVLLQCSGSEANDTAVKLVWYYWHAHDKPQKRKIISRRGSYHGSTCVCTSLTAKPEYHQQFGLPFEGFLYVNCPNYYRFAQQGESEEQFSQRLADELEALILAESPDTIAAFWADPVQGGAGALPPPSGYFEKVQAILRKYDILFVVDEVICGFARTGNMWGSTTCGLEPDILTCAKQLSAAMQPISAVLVNQKIFEAILIQSDRTGGFVHGYTYAGHPVAAAVALETLRIYEEIDIVSHVRAVTPVLMHELNTLLDHPMIGDISGRGLLVGLELVMDKKARTGFPAAAKLSAVLDRHAKANRLIMRTMDGRIALSPPLIISEEEVVEMTARLRRTLDGAWGELRSLGIRPEGPASSASGFDGPGSATERSLDQRQRV